MTTSPEPRELTETDLEKAADALAGIRAMIDPMSGRIDNWSGTR
jgi:hypothetical protein